MNASIRRCVCAKVIGHLLPFVTFGTEVLTGDGDVTSPGHLYVSCALFLFWRTQVKEDSPD